MAPDPRQVFYFYLTFLKVTNLSIEQGDCTGFRQTQSIF